jgi:hypothetical protein
MSSAQNPLNTLGNFILFTDARYDMHDACNHASYHQAKNAADSGID